MKANSQKTKTSKGDLLRSGLERGAPSKSPFDSQMPSQNGGQTTISPPAKVKLDKTTEVQTLASNIDTLVLAIDVEWKNNKTFRYLESIKNIAKDYEKEAAVVFYAECESDMAMFNIRPHGTNGYEWLLIGGEFSLTIGNWIYPISRPSIMASIHSETLWRNGPEGAVKRLFRILEGENARIVTVKVSRVDPCLDILMHQSLWKLDLIENRVTRSKYAAPHFDNFKLTGISIGKGKFSARLYDKPLEIKVKSHDKIWMYDFWGLNKVPEGYKIIRVEFQIRREALKELKIDSETDLFNKLGNLWKYCTEKWLKFQDGKGNHHTMRKTFDWWKIVQNGFEGVQGANPLIRSKAIKVNLKQQLAQTYGHLTSLMAIKMEVMGIDHLTEINLDDMVSILRRELLILYGNKNDLDISSDVLRKRARYHRAMTAKPSP